MATRFGTTVLRFLKDESGPTAVEYAVMLALIIVVCVSAITWIGGGANSVFSNTSLNIAAGNASGGS
jgi:pilus assembly protein Flp/PilA